MSANGHPAAPPPPPNHERRWADRAASEAAARAGAFSLIELMIGIVILGLGMVMVATMFPVAWSRARKLNEYTVQKAVVAGAHDTIKALARVSRPDFQGPSVVQDASSLQGDLLFYTNFPPDPTDDFVISACSAVSAINPPFPTDTWVHALNLENIQVQNRRFVDENPWRLQDPHETLYDEYYNPATSNIDPGDYDAFIGNSYFYKQLSFHQRVYPPMRPRLNVDPDGYFTGNDDLWDDELATRRFFLSVLHRLREPLRYIPGNVPANEQAVAAARSFDVYYVTLRRTQSTFRYARQDPAFTPNPCYLANPNANDPTPVVPEPAPPEEDLMFPVPWRVQVEFFAESVLPKAMCVGGPNDAQLCTVETDCPNGTCQSNETGIPTEIVVPPLGMGADDSIKAMLVQMFPERAQFIDEVSGQVYRVVKRRVIGDELEQAFLTLDREVFVEDLDIPDERCENSALEDIEGCERLRTVWVFPPPVEANRVNDVLAFQGQQPVVDIDVRTLNIAPTQ